MTLKTNSEAGLRSSYYRGHEWFIAKLQDQFALIQKKRVPVQTSFLTPVEQRIVSSCAPKEIFVSFYGGYPYAQRKMAFLSLYEQEPDFDYTLLQSSYIATKRKLTHKDVLGALMHLGIQRNQLGDLYVDDHQIVLVCKENMASFIQNECDSIARCHVSFKENYQIVLPPPQTELIKVHAPSLRMDAIVASLAHCSRSQASELVRQGFVKLNDVVLEENERLCNNDYVSIRKVGRFCFMGIEAHTRKDRLVLRFEKYV